MGLPVVAIVGRPNVGKSSLLNSLSRRLTAIVTPTLGTTRDPVNATVEHAGRIFDLIDTGGMGMDDAEQLVQEVEAAIRKTIDAADLVLFVVDVRAGLIPLDRQIADLLRKFAAKVILVVNKVDDKKMAGDVVEFHALAFDDPLPLSARHNIGRDALLDAITARLPEPDAEGEVTPVMKLAIVGKRNTGKSTFANQLAREERMIVSDLAGTTRDSVDIRFEKDGNVFLAIDTAGLRKKARIDSQIEQFSAHRAERAIRRANVVLFFLDATVDISQVDMKICSYIVKHYKPCVLVVNKWDMADTVSTEAYVGYLEKKMPGMAFAPIAFISAKNGERVHSAIDLARTLHKQAHHHAGTSHINAVLDRFRDRPLKSSGGKKAPRIYFGAQVSTAPPLIVLSVNDPSVFGAKHRRTILNRLRESLPYHEVPIELRLRSHRRKTKEKSPQ